MEQEVKYISIEQLVLWTENPRDPINKNATDKAVIDRAVKDPNGKWSLTKLAKEMGDYYDLSELPTVVYHGNEPVVYDGNRRIILGKIKHGFVSLDSKIDEEIPVFPIEIPCNVCSEEIALKNVYRKHSESGSWSPLERDIFLHKFMKKEKTPFLVLEDSTGLISKNPHLNKRFVKDEIFKEEVLKSIGFSTESGELRSVHNEKEGSSILSDISKKIKDKEITTRKNRGKVLEVLEPSSQMLIDENKSNPSFTSFSKKKDQPKGTASTKATTEKKRQTKRTFAKEPELFGGKLYLQLGEVSNLYRDIVDLNKFYIDNKDHLSQTFHSLIRMSLRLLCETAATEKNKSLESYMKDNLDLAPF